MKKIIIIAIAVVIIGGTINDVGKYATALYYLDQSTTDIANKAADAAKSSGGSRDVGGGAAMQAASAQGVEVYGYDQNLTSVRVWTRKQVPGTILYGPIKALMSKKPWDTPFSVTDDATAYID